MVKIIINNEEFFWSRIVVELDGYMRVVELFRESEI